MKLISRHHADLYRRYYAGRDIVGKASQWLPRVEKLAAELGAQTILDYGCGANRGLSRFSQLKIADYDPGLEGHDRRPRPADLVVCLHVLEHVEPQHVDAVIADLKCLARKALLVAVCCEHSTKVLPDGSAWHSFVRDAAWWQLRLSEFEPQPTVHDRPGAEFAALYLK